MNCFVTPSLRVATSWWRWTAKIHCFLPFVRELASHEMDPEMPMFLGSHWHSNMEMYPDLVSVWSRAENASRLVSTSISNCTCTEQAMLDCARNCPCIEPLYYGFLDTMHPPWPTNHYEIQCRSVPGTPVLNLRLPTCGEQLLR
jgi:hypothetical protein